MGIYKIISPSGKVYIGQALVIEKRWDTYEKRPNSYKNQRKLYNSIQKYGWNNHQKEILEECLEDKLLERENYYKQSELDKVDNDWSKVLFLRFDGKGGRLSEETKQRIREKRKYFRHTEESKQKMRKPRPGSGDKLRGRKRTEEQIEKMRKPKPGTSEKRKGMKFSVEHRKKMSESSKGRIFTEEHKRKIREAKAKK